MMDTGIYAGIKNGKEIYKTNKKPPTQFTVFIFKVFLHSLVWDLWLKRAQKAHHFHSKSLKPSFHAATVLLPTKGVESKTVLSSLYNHPTSGPRWTDPVHLNQGLANFSVKSQIVNTLGLASYMVSVATSQPCLQSTNAAIDYTNYWVWWLCSNKSLFIKNRLQPRFDP